MKKSNNDWLYQRYQQIVTDDQNDLLTTERPPNYSMIEIEELTEEMGWAEWHPWLWEWGLGYCKN